MLSAVGLIKCVGLVLLKTVRSGWSSQAYVKGRFVVRLFEETRRHNSMQSFYPNLQEKVWPLKEPLHCCLMNTVHSAIGLCRPEGFCRVTIRRSYQLSAVMGCFASLELELVSRT